MIKKFLKGKTAVFIDYANMKSWLKQMNVLVDLEVFYRYFKNLPSVEKVYFYYGTDLKNPKSNNFIQKIRQIGFDVTTKPVKYSKISLLDLCNKPINQQMFNQLNKRLKRRLMENIKFLNKKGVFLLSPKCNMDVEITMDMLLFQKKFDTFVLFSGDSDFESIVKFLRGKGKKVIVISTRKFLSGELFKSASYFFNFKKLLNVKRLIKSKKTRAPKRSS